MTSVTSPATPLPPIPSQDVPTDRLAALQRFATDLATASRAPNTRRTYASALGTFESWADTLGRTTLPATPETVALYVAHLAREGRKSSTIDRALAAISQAHLDAGFASPRSASVVRRVVRGARRRPGAEPSPKKALTEVELARMLDALPRDLAGLRDRAVLALGFATGLRRSELVALDVGHVTATDSGLVVVVVRSKTDHEGRGRRIKVDRTTDNGCALRAVEEWIQTARVVDGPLFLPVLRGGHGVRRRLSDKVVDRIIKRAAELAQVDVAGISAHSLRSGYATAQASKGVAERALMKRLGHTDPAMTRRYVRLAEED